MAGFPSSRIRGIFRLRDRGGQQSCFYSGDGYGGFFACSRSLSADCRGQVQLSFSSFRRCWRTRGQRCRSTHRSARGEHHCHSFPSGRSIQTSSSESRSASYPKDSCTSPSQTSSFFARRCHWVRRWYARAGSSSGCGCSECRHREESFRGVLKDDAAKEDSNAGSSQRCGQASEDQVGHSWGDRRGAGGGTSCCTRPFSRTGRSSACEAHQDCGQAQFEQSFKGEASGGGDGGYGCQHRWSVIQHQQWELQASCPRSSCAASSAPGVTGRDLRGYERQTARRLWISRGGSGRGFDSAHVPWLGRTSEQVAQHQCYGEDRMVHSGSSRLFGAGKDGGGPMQTSSLPGYVGPSGHRPWQLGLSPCWGSRRCTSLRGIWPPCVAGFPGTSAQQVMAVSLGGRLHVPDSRAGRVHGEKVEARKEAAGVGESSGRSPRRGGKRQRSEGEERQRQGQESIRRRARQRSVCGGVKQSVKHQVLEEAAQALPPSVASAWFWGDTAPTSTRHSGFYSSCSIMVVLQFSVTQAVWWTFCRIC